MAKKEKPPCTVSDCQRPQYARAYCNKHYQQWRRNKFSKLPGGNKKTPRKKPNPENFPCGEDFNNLLKEWTDVVQENPNIFDSCWKAADEAEILKQCDEELLEDYPELKKYIKKM